MKKAPIPDYEQERLKELQRLRILDTGDEVSFDEITELAASICGARIALISIVDADRQWFKSRFGLAAHQTPRDISFCGHAIMGDEIFEVPNAELALDFCDNPLFLNEPHVRFYAGAPLRTKNGFRVGTLCVIDDHEKHLTATQRQMLSLLAKQVVALFELRVSQLENQFIKEQLERAQEISKIGSWQFDLKTKEQFWSGEHYRIFEIPAPQSQDRLHQMYRERIHPDDLARLDYLVDRAVRYGEDFIYDHRVYLDSGRRIKYVQGIGKVIKDSNGVPVAVTGTCRDMTSTIESETKFKAILGAISDGLVVQDARGAITEFNPAALNILGLSEEELLGRTSVDPRWRCLRLDGVPFPGEEHPAMVALKTGKVQRQVPMVVEKSDGTMSWINITSVPVFAEGVDKPTSVITTFADMTESQRSQAERQITMDFVPAGIFRTDANGSCIFVNRRWCEIAGISENEALGQGWASALHPDDRKKVFEEWSTAVSQERPFELDYRFLHKNGSVRYVQGRSIRIKDLKGEPIGHLGSIQDITKLKETEEFNTFYKIALDEAAIVAMTDVRGKITYVNEMFCRISEYSREELIGKDHRILNSGKMGSAFFKKMWATISTGKQWNGKICNRSKSGREYWVDTTIVPFKNSEGIIQRYIAIRRDITNEVRAQEALQEKTREMNSFFSVSLDLLCVGDSSGRYKRVNPAFKSVLGYDADELLNTEFMHFIHPGDLAATQKEFEKVQQGVPTSRFENRHRCKDGTYKVLSWAVSVNPDDGLMYGAARDVTAEHKKQEELRQLTIDLDAARMNAEQATLAKSEFLSTMTHEIRTPLNGVIGMTELLLDSGLNPDQGEIARTISQSGKSLLSIVNDVLDFSKIEAGKLELELVDIDLKDYFNEVLKPFRYGAQKKGVAFEFSTNHCGYAVRGDEGRIGQIVSNLVSNAIKFTKKGGVYVELRQTEAPADATTVIVEMTVRDTGIGISESAKTRIFREFMQAEQSTTRNFGGTGLGLSISKRLANMMGGEISFESTFGVGTTFTVSIPLKKSTTHVSNQSRANYPATLLERRGDASLSGRVLVAEDNPTNQTVVQRMLTKLGLKSHVVGNGNEVIAALQDQKFDLVLMDCQMPDMDGYAATKMIRESEILPRGIPIIALTANASTADELRCREFGMNAYVTKPISLKSLEQILTKFLTVKPVFIDRSVLKQFDDLQVEGLPDILIETIDSFLKTSVERVSLIQQYTKNREYLKASKEAHALKSSAYTLGARLLGNLCEQIEHEFRNLEVVVPPEDRVNALIEQHRFTCEELSALRNERLQVNRGAA